ncbi:MAG: PEP-CTERM sorting domain-containing protein [Planctomycetes bacterium]|nr:PEP-CTERM sorting domain-containing protein [Planctomycetota bacterium]
MFDFPPQWAFGSVTGVTGGQGVQGFPLLGIDFWTQIGSDRDFQLSGSPVPAPGALALLGVAGLAGMRRRRRK